VHSPQLVVHLVDIGLIGAHCIVLRTEASGRADRRMADNQWRAESLLRHSLATGVSSVVPYGHTKRYLSVCLGDDKLASQECQDYQDGIDGSTPLA